MTDIIRELCLSILKKEGSEIDETTNGREAFEQISRESFHRVITDLEMPRMKGIELIDKIVPFIS